MPPISSAPNATRSRRTLLGALIATWLTSVVVGFGLITASDVRPATKGVPRTEWPATSQLPRSDTGWTLVMFAHPRCPCSRASIDELARVANACSGLVQVHLALVLPPGTDGSFAQTSLLGDAARIPGVHIFLDEAAREANRFGGQASGQTYLYDHAGHLKFSGGITGARGHFGANPASDALISIIRGDADTMRETDVFGCPLRAPATREYQAMP
jgi:hypothetical protein